MLAPNFLRSMLDCGAQPSAFRKSAFGTCLLSFRPGSQCTTYPGGDPWYDGSPNAHVPTNESLNGGLRPRTLTVVRDSDFLFPRLRRGPNNAAGAGRFIDHSGQERTKISTRKCLPTDQQFTCLYKLLPCNPCTDERRLRTSVNSHAHAWSAHMTTAAGAATSRRQTLFERSKTVATK